MKDVRPRLRLNVVESHQAAALSWNYPREVWAERKQCFSSFTLAKTTRQLNELLENIVTNKNSLEFVVTTHKLNKLFLTCVCIEDHRVLANTAFDSYPQCLELFKQLTIQGEKIAAVALLALYNMSYAPNACQTMVDIGLVEVLFGVFPLAPVFTTSIAFNLLERLVDTCPAAAARVQIPRNVRVLLTKLETVDGNYRWVPVALGILSNTLRDAKTQLRVQSMIGRLQALELKYPNFPLLRTSPSLNIQQT